MNYKEIFEEFISYTSRLVESLTEIVNDLRFQNEGEGLEKINIAFEGLKWTIDTIIYIEQLYYSNPEKSNEIKEILTTIVEALENRDYVLLADVFEYEVLPLIKNYQEKFIQETIS